MLEKTVGRVLKRSVGEECCREELEKTVGEECCREVWLKGVVAENCWRSVL